MEIKFIKEKVLAAKQHHLGVSFFFYGSLWNYAPESPQKRKEKILTFFPDSSPRKIPISKFSDNSSIFKQLKINKPAKNIFSSEGFNSTPFILRTGVFNLVKLKILILHNISF